MLSLRHEVLPPILLTSPDNRCDSWSSLEQRLLRVCALLPATGLLEGGRWRIARVLDLLG
jgi:hypothetical protein